MESATTGLVDADTMALMFVRALLLGTDKVKNKAHEVAPCAVVFWEDEYCLENTILPNGEKV